jgi:hypothetical protein
MNGLPGAPRPQTVIPPRVEGDLSINRRSHKDRTRVFLHQLSQALTSLRGVLELALLIDGDEQEYRRAIQQSLAQAEGLVQTFKSFRASTEAEPSGLGDEQVGLAEIVRLALEQLRPFTDSRRLVVHLELGDNGVAPSDPARLLVALHRALLCAVQQSPAGGMLKVAVSSHAKSACLTLSATRRCIESTSLRASGTIPAPESTKAFAGVIAERDWASMRSAVEALGGSVLKITTEAFPLLCEICIPLSRP